MIRVLFVCLGNICRSPMAEAVFRHLVDAAGLSREIAADSAGLGGWHIGEKPHIGTRRVLAAKGIRHDWLTARQIAPTDFERFDYIVCMDAENLRELQRIAPPGKKLYRLLEFAPDINEQNVEDPYYTGRFDHVYQLVEAGCRGLLAKICEEHGLPR
ncbi:low molecular weight protein-tyrosine-phosphatase [Brevibacillus marinus]|uniref:low molecular weight protein-tyrosine-phosphatase n=1 Tax=Brevibacillus marinus TaxID=2496837 RepID=UPI000F837C52|nr:low molecular weight protein-tyrosine-phosphatase [Brevibacillus marinus]